MNIKKIQWNIDTKTFEPEIQAKPKWQINNELTSNLLDHNNRQYELFITLEAKEQIWQHIGYGIKTLQNVNEQGGILLGKVYLDEEKNLIYGIVSHALAGTHAEGSPAYLEMNHNVWIDMLTEADRLADNSTEQFQILGWYHTHPNGLDVFMSGTDRETQKKWFKRDWHFAVVINPHRKIWRVFHGGLSEECSGYYLSDKTNGEPQILQNITTPISTVVQEGHPKSSNQNNAKTRQATPTRGSNKVKNVTLLCLYAIVFFIAGCAYNKFILTPSPIVSIPQEKENNNQPLPTDSMQNQLTSPVFIALKDSILAINAKGFANMHQQFEIENFKWQQDTNNSVIVIQFSLVTDTTKGSVKKDSSIKTLPLNHNPPLKFEHNKKPIRNESKMTNKTNNKENENIETVKPDLQPDSIGKNEIKDTTSTKIVTEQHK